jgi:hypothetical protein
VAQLSFSGDKRQGTFINRINEWRPIPVAARSKAWVRGRSLAGIAGSNPAGGMNVCLLWILCVVQVEVSATDWSLVQGSLTGRGMSKLVWSWSLVNEEALAH